MHLPAGKKTIRVLRRGDPKFMIHDGVVMYPRAGIEISEKTPPEHKDMIAQYIANGWIKPLAYMKEAEITWEELSE